MTRTEARRSSRQEQPAQENRAVAVVPAKEAAATIQRSIEGRRDQFLDLVGGDERLTDRFITVAMSAVVKPGSGLLDADPLSIVNAIRDSFQMGLEPAGPLGEGAIVAYRDGDRKIAQFQPMYRGLRKLAMQHPDVTVVNAGIRHEKDVFEYREGTDPFIRHEPWIDDEDPGAVMGAYAYAKVRGELVVLYMNTAQIRKRRNVARTDKIWQAWEEEMMLKTVTSRLIRSKLPMTTKLGLATSVDEADLDRNPATPPEPARVTRTQRRLAAGEDVPDAPERPETAETAESGTKTQEPVEGESRAVCGAQGMKEGEVCVLDPHTEGPHEAENGAVWG